MTYFIYDTNKMIIAAYDDIGVMLFDYIEYLKTGLDCHFGYMTEVPDIFWSPMSSIVQ
jgi:hypothetical protein